MARHRLPVEVYRKVTSLVGRLCRSSLVPIVAEVGEKYGIGEKIKVAESERGALLQGMKLGDVYACRSVLLHFGDVEPQELVKLAREVVETALARGVISQSTASYILSAARELEEALAQYAPAEVGAEATALAY